MPYICIHNGAQCTKNNFWLSYENCQTRQGFIRIKGLDYREYDVGKSQVDLFISKEAYIINVISIRMLYSTT